MSTTATKQRRQPKKPPEIGGKFRLLVSTHIDDGPPGCDCDHCVTSAGKSHCYEAGDIIESKRDLAQRYNSQFSKKFERVDEQPLPAGQVLVSQEELDNLRKIAAKSTAPAFDFDKATEKQLREYAEENEIDISKCKTPDDIRKAVRPSAK